MTKIKTILNNDISIYPLYSDLMAKHIFGYQGRVKYLIYLLEEMFNVASGTYKNVKILNSVKIDKENIYEKGFEMDIVALLDNGEVINVEFYSEYDKNAEIKSLLYITSQFKRNLKSGDDYKNIRKTTQLNIVKNNRMHKELDDVINEYYLINGNDLKDRIAPDLIGILIFDIDVAKKMSYNLSARLNKWGKLFGATTIEEMEEAVKGDKIMEEILEEMKTFSREEYVTDFFNRERLIRSQHNSELEEVRLKSHEQGQESKTFEIAKSLLEKNISEKIISEVTGLTIDEITKLKNSD